MPIPTAQQLLTKAASLKSAVRKKQVNTKDYYNNLMLKYNFKQWKKISPSESNLYEMSERVSFVCAAAGSICVELRRAPHGVV